MMKQVFSKAKEERNILVILFLVAIVVKFYFIKQMGNIMPWSDMQGYDNYAVEILLGRGYNTVWPPLYLYFLSGLYYFFGHNYWVVKLVQIFISAFTSIIIYFIGRESINAARYCS